MTTLHATTSLESTRWAEPFETICQAQRRARGQGSGRGYRPDITPPLRLLIASAVAMGKDRPRGMITWLAVVLATSRRTIYAIGAAWGPKVWTEQSPAEAEIDPEERRRQIARAALDAAGAWSDVPAERAVPRAWQRAQTVTNGARRGRPHALRAADTAAGLCQNDPVAKRLAAELDRLLEGTVRTSSACENVNSILWAYLWGRRAFKSRRTAQNWLNLLMLWHNPHVFQRGKRKGRNPFELAGVVVHAPDGEPTSDWLAALGYAPAA